MYKLSGTNNLRYSLIPSLFTLVSIIVRITVSFLINGSKREWQTLVPLKLQEVWVIDFELDRLLSKVLTYLSIFWRAVLIILI